MHPRDLRLRHPGPQQLHDAALRRLAGPHLRPFQLSEVRCSQGTVCIQILTLSGRRSIKLTLISYNVLALLVFHISLKYKLGLEPCFFDVHIL